MIKPRFQPSHFELRAEKQPWKTEGMFQQCSSDSFNPSNVESNLPVTPMASVTPSAAKDRDSKVTSLSDPISSTGAIQPSITSSEGGISPAFPSTSRHSTHATKGVPPVRYTPSKK